MFQGYYNAVSSGATATRARPGGHRAYQATIDFCDKYDQAAFDPVMRSMPLEPFDPIVRRVHARPLPSWNRMWQD